MPRKGGVGKSCRWWGSVHFCCTAASKLRLLPSVSICAWSSTFQPLVSDPDLITSCCVLVLDCLIPTGLPGALACEQSPDAITRPALPWVLGPGGAAPSAGPARARSGLSPLRPAPWGCRPLQGTESIPELLKTMSPARNTSTFKSTDLLHRISVTKRVR